MRILEGFDLYKPFRKPVITVGSYDGVHTGHRELLSRITALARENGGESVVVTFSPHPRQVIGEGEEVQLINSIAEKAVLLEKAGIDNLLIAPFTEEFSKVSSYDFIKDFLVGKLGLSTLVVGYNHHFGRNREGNYDYLDKLREELGFDVYMVARRDVDEHKVSSTVIRDLINRGELAGAVPYLGYRYFISGEAGEEAGQFTAGSDAKLLPPAGEYPVHVRTGLPTGENITVIGNARLSILPDRRMFLSGTGELSPGTGLTVTFC